MPDTSLIPGHPVNLSGDLCLTLVSDDDPRAVAGHGQTLLIEHRGWADSLFTLWFPESINIPELGCVAANWLRQSPLTWRYDSDSHTVSHVDSGSGYSYAAIISAAGELLRLRLTLTNSGLKDYSPGWLNVCLRTCHAPAFVDPHLERTMVLVGGKWCSLASVLPGFGGNELHLLVEGPENLFFLRHSLRSWSDLVVAPGLERAETIRVDVNGTRAVRFRAKRSPGLVFNLQNNMHCLHCIPWVPSLGAGATADIEAEIEFTSFVM